MKQLFMLAALLISSFSYADTLNPSDSIIACVKKDSNPYQYKSYKLFFIDQFRKLAYYENSSGGSETQKLISLEVNNKVLTAVHNSGTKETLTVNFATGAGKWVENAYPANVENYPICMSFSSYNIKQIRSWLTQLGL